VSRTLADHDENALVDFIAQTFKAASIIRVGIGDDCAVIQGSSSDQVVTMDAMIESVHFDRKTMSASDIGRKLVAVNVSDLAAMGAKPSYGLLSAWQSIMASRLREVTSPPVRGPSH
jgi:thiamine-monophosphate kinase